MTLGDTRGGAHAVVDTLANTLPEVEAVRLGHTRGDADELVHTLTYTLAEVEVMTL